MTVSRRIFLRGGVFTAAAFAAVPFESFAAGRVLPGDNPAPRNNPGNTAVDPGSGTHRQSPSEQYAGLSKLSRDAFSSVVGTPFKVGPMSGNGERFWVRLLSVHDFSNPAPMNSASMAVAPKQSQPSPATVSFNLAFSGGPAKNVREGTYLFQHSELGQFAMFVMPSGPQQYSAVINWLQTRTAIPV